MHIITIACAPVALQFVFKTKEAATNNWKILNAGGETIEFVDDFGQTGFFKMSQITCRTMEDCDLSKRAHVERSLHQQRMQHDAQKAFESDPVLRMSGGRGGAPIIQPFMDNGRGS